MSIFNHMRMVVGISLTLLMGVGQAFLWPLLTTDPNSTTVGAFLGGVVIGLAGTLFTFIWATDT